jgi:hypothetical protein
MLTDVDPAAQARRERIIAGMRGRSLDEAAADPQVRQDLRDEAASPDPDRLVTPDLVRLMDEARELRLKQPSLQLFFSTDDVILVPGFLGSQLADTAGRDGLIWIDPKLVFGAAKLMDLRLAPFRDGQPDADAAAGVAIRPQGEIPVIYAGLRFALEVQRYHTEVFGFDWRKDLDESAAALAQVIRDRANHRFRPLHLIAHSQGSLVARRALQLLGSELARQLVNNLVLLGPASAGTFSAALAIAGNNSLLDTLRTFHIIPPPEFGGVPQSLSGLYQLLPWRTEPVRLPAGAPGDGSNGDGRPNRDLPLDWVRQHDDFHEPAFWQTGVDRDRLAKFFGWGRTIDASFFNDRTTIILGDQPTVGGVQFQGGTLVEDEAFKTWGDGTVPDAFALVDGVTRVYRARGGVHTTLPAMLSVITAVHQVLIGRKPRLAAPGLGAAAGAAVGAADVPFLAEAPPGLLVAPAAPAPVPPPDRQPPVPYQGETGRPVPPPQYRRLRVFSFDPLLGTDLDALGTEQLTVELPWDFADGDFLRPGPAGEYLEVVDRDPANDCFYPPVDLNHPHLLAQDGLPLSEGDPRFHQQMAYAVAMSTIHQFEVALGRTALWGPHLVRNDTGEVVPPARPEDEYVRRLRIYPHGLRQANAFYDPDRKALLFGYFPAQGADVGRNLPGGMIFTCLSHDVIAHETTHALLDGVHRYFTEPSSPDVFAFHEAFADVVALFQHFSHPEVLRDQIARAEGDLQRENALGVLAAQFGEAIGHRGALRQYLGRRTDDGWEPIKPDPAAIAQTHEPHERGAILVAALFRAFTNIYENRVRDLRRIATGGSGILPAGDLHPDLVNRMAKEAARAARHMLSMCVRALDYIPPVDITFGEYLRALITADYDLVRDDDRRYRVSVVGAFRDWGIYPPGVRSLSVDSLLWAPAEADVIRRLDEFFRAQQLDVWALGTDRRHAYLEMRRVNLALHDWLQDENNRAPGREWALGLCLGPGEAPGSLRRDKAGRPVFEVHSCRPCRRIGPDGQQKTDVVVELVQRRKAYFDPNRQQQVDADKKAAWDELPPHDFYFRGGCTLLIDPHSGEVRYCVRKAVWEEGDARLANERSFRQGQFGDKVGGAYLSGDHDDVNPFAFLHGSR